VLGCPDPVFTRAKVLVFCNGNFWHSRDWEQLRDDQALRHNAEYWIAKIGWNREKDQEQSAWLSVEGCRHPSLGIGHCP